LHALGAGADGEETVHETHKGKDDSDVDDEADDDEGDESINEETVRESGTVGFELEVLSGIGRTNHTKEGGDERGDESIDEFLEGSTNNDGDSEVDDITPKDEISEACDKT
jgi:hypothetical protein